MNATHASFTRILVPVGAFIFALWASFAGQSSASVALAQAYGTIPPNKPELANPGMECEFGYTSGLNSLGEPIYIPSGWTLAVESGAPIVHSGRIFFEQRVDSTGGCTTSRAHVERIEGRDSVVVRARDLETNPEPGKAFDFILSQTVPVMEGGDYSLSSWMLSLCGGSAVPSDCPDGVYIAKSLGIDPSGGSDPFSASVVWVEDRRNFVDENDERIGWSNLRVGARAESDHITVFARLESPFQHHGNHGFIDSLSLVRSPKAWFEAVPGVVHNRRSFDLVWNSSRSPDVDAVPGGTYEYAVDIQVREQGADVWNDLAMDLADGAGSALFCAPQSNITYEFRIRARAEQPPAPPDGAWPNHRYPGAWSDPMTVRFATSVVSSASKPGPHQVFIPIAGFSEACDLLP